MERVLNVNRSAGESFQPKLYELTVDPQDDSWTVFLKIEGFRRGRISQRFTFLQKNLKVKKAKLTRKHKGQQIELKVLRINHLKGRQQVRLHTQEKLYPGPYTLNLEYELPAAKGEQLLKCSVVASFFRNHPPQEYLPSAAGLPDVEGPQYTIKKKGQDER